MDAVMIPTARRTIGDTMAALLREASLLVVACGVAGALVGGLGSRFVMRLAALAAPEASGLVTDNGNVVGEFTLGGTASLMLFVGVGSAVLGAGAFTILRPWLPHGTIARGVAFGGLLLPLLGTSVLDPANPDFALLGDPFLSVVLFSGLFVAFGLVASITLAMLDGRLRPAAALSPRSWALTVLGALPVIPGTLGVVATLSPRLGLPLLGAWVAATAARSLARRGRHGLAQLVRIGATAALVVVVALAGAAFVDAVRAIVSTG
jgi:hypothetical protein